MWVSEIPPATCSEMLVNGHESEKIIIFMKLLSPLKGCAYGYHPAFQ